MKALTARRRIFIDFPVQGSLVLRILAYWCACVALQTGVIVLVALLWDPADEFYGRLDQLWSYLKLSAIASLFVLPIVVLDVVRLSHRWSGPIFRLRKSLRSLAKGEEVAAIQFRQGDYWQELAEDFNVVAARLKALERAQPRQRQPEAEPEEETVGQPVRA